MMRSDEERQLSILYMAAQLAYAQDHAFPVQAIVNGHVVKMHFTCEHFTTVLPGLQPPLMVSR